MNEHEKTPVPAVKAQALQRAFDAFNQVSVELTLAYEGLQAKLASLTQELALANGELRRQYQEKEALSERLSLLLDALPAGVVVLNSAAKISEANPAARAMLGDLTLGTDWEKWATTQLLPTDTCGEWQLNSRRIAIAESPLDSAGGRILLLHDITTAYHLKTDLERSKHLAAMGEMAASLAHQLRTPLAAALLYSANLALPNLSDAARTRFAEKASAQLRRLERLIQDVLLFARGESIGRELIDVRELLTETAQTISPLLQEKGVAFELDIGLDENDSNTRNDNREQTQLKNEFGNNSRLILSGNRKALSGALLNLLENALEACISGASALKKVTVTVQYGASEVRIAVSDTGSGINPKLQARIFEPFFTTRAQGTGLGLALALGVARAHGGSIEVRSAPHNGAVFVLSLPISAGL